MHTPLVEGPTMCSNLICLLCSIRWMSLFEKCGMETWNVLKHLETVKGMPSPSISNNHYLQRHKGLCLQFQGSFFFSSQRLTIVINEYPWSHSYPFLGIDLETSHWEPFIVVILWVSLCFTQCCPTFGRFSVKNHPSFPATEKEMHQRLQQIPIIRLHLSGITQGARKKWW